VDRLHPDRQTWHLGDSLWMYPRDRAGGAGFAVLRGYIPGRVLAFGTHVPGAPAGVEDGSWSFVLEPLGDSATRLLVRGRGAVGHSLLGVAFETAIFEPVHFVMERRTMIGIAQLAEGRDRGRIANHVQVLLWTITFGMFVAAAVMVVRRRSWVRPLVGFVASAAVFQVLTLGQPPVWVGLVLVAGLGALLWWPTRARTTPPSIAPHQVGEEAHR